MLTFHIIPFLSTLTSGAVLPALSPADKISQAVSITPAKSPQVSPLFNYPQAYLDPEISPYQTNEVEESELQEEEESPDSPPYAVQVGSTKFYGGLVTFGHELHPARICRVLNACVRNDGTVVLPAWTRRYDEMLSFHCGIHKLEFSLEDTEAPPTLRNQDLFGSEPAPVAVHKFITDFAPQLVALDMLSGERSLSKTCHSRIGRSCDSFPLLNAKIRPAVFVHPEIQKQARKTSWIQQFMSLIPTDNYAHKIRRIPQEYRADENSESVQCFRSIVLTRSPRTKFAINPETLRALKIFEKNGVNKIPKTARERVKGKGCNVNVMFVNRKKMPRHSTELGVEGYITNIGHLRKEIKKRVQKFKGLAVKINAVTLDGKRLKFQIDAMQKADILVAGSGPALANMIFLRSNSTVMELMPFGYYPKTYENMARYVADVKYDSYIAHPDQKTFLYCLSRVAPRGSGNFTAAERVITRYKRAASKYRRSDSTHSYTLHNLAPELNFVSPCATVQRLNTTAEHFATAIVRNARLQCGIGLA